MKRFGLILIFMVGFCSYRPGNELPESELNAVREWQSFYRRHFGLEPDLKNIDMPPLVDGYDRLIIVASGLSYERLIIEMRRKFDVVFVNKYLPNYFDNNFTHIRNNNKAYAIRVRDRIESGETDIGRAGIEKITPGNRHPLPVINEMTLMERLLFEMKYHEETNQHLDLETFTVCAGSHFKRDSLALSPAVGWKQGIDEYFTPYLYISECYDVYTIDGMYSRNVITLK